MPAELAAGRIGRAHGLDGSFHVTRPRARLLVLGAAVRVGTRETRIVRCDGTEDRPIVRLAGVEGRDAIESLRGEDLWVARADAPPLEAGEFYAEDVVGVRVFDGEREVGAVARLLTYPSCDLLEVDRGPGAEPLLIPLVDDAVRSLDLEGRRADISLAFLGEEG